MKIANFEIGNLFKNWIAYFCRRDYKGNQQKNEDFSLIVEKILNYKILLKNCILYMIMVC